MGTIHIADPRVCALPAPIREAFEGSEQAAFELLMTPEDGEVIARRRVPDDSEPLAELVDSETYRRVVALAARYGIPEQAVGRISPGALACLFRTPPEEFRRRADGALFLDHIGTTAVRGRVVAVRLYIVGRHTNK